MKTVALLLVVAIAAVSAFDGANPAQRCGGIAFLRCPDGFDCKLDGPYPDAMGTCVPSRPKCKAVGEQCDWGRDVCCDGASCQQGHCKATGPQMCGGIAAIKCPAGFDCKLDGSYPDASGICVPQAACKPVGDVCNWGRDVCCDGATCVQNHCKKVAQRCGGIAGLRCPAGFDCKLDGSYPDAMGTCIPHVACKPVGESCQQSDLCCDGSICDRAQRRCIYPVEPTVPCGGIAGLRCPPDMVCKLESSHPDAMGTCVPAPVMRCGGIAGIRCPQGYSCKHDSPGPDAMGICVRVANRLYDILEAVHMVASFSDEVRATETVPAQTAAPVAPVTENRDCLMPGAKCQMGVDKCCWGRCIAMGANTICELL